MSDITVSPLSPDDIERLENAANDVLKEARDAAVNIALIREIRRAQNDFMEWMQIGRWLAKKLGDGSEVEATQWIFKAREALGLMPDQKKEAAEDD